MFKFPTIPEKFKPNLDQMKRYYLILPNTVQHYKDINYLTLTYNFNMNPVTKTSKFILLWNLIHQFQISYEKNDQSKKIRKTEKEDKFGGNSSIAIKNNPRSFFD